MSFEQASVTVVADYVRRLQLNGFTFTDYADILERERINGKVFLALTLDGFNSIGIIDYPRRKLFHQHIELLRSQHNSPGSASSASLHNNTTIRFKLEPTTATATSGSTSVPVTPKLRHQTVSAVTPYSGGNTNPSSSSGPLPVSTDSMKHQEFNEAIGRLLATNKLNLNLPPFPIFEPMGGAMKRPFTAMSMSSDVIDSVHSNSTNSKGSTVSLNAMHSHSMHSVHHHRNAKRPKLNDSFHSMTPHLKAETDRVPVPVPVPVHGINTKRGRFKVTTSSSSSSTKKRKGSTRYTYRRWTEEENEMMRECCGNKEPSRIDWTMIQREKMPYRTICGIRQHWENMQKRDRRDRQEKEEVVESRKALYESENSSDDEGDDSHDDTQSDDEDDDDNGHDHHHRDDNGNAEGEDGQSEHAMVIEEKVDSMISVSGKMEMPKLTE